MEPMEPMEAVDESPVAAMAAKSTELVDAKEEEDLANTEVASPAVQAERSALEQAIASQNRSRIVKAFEAGGVPCRYDAKFTTIVGRGLFGPLTQETTLMGVVLAAGRIDLADRLLREGVLPPVYASPDKFLRTDVLKDASESMDALYSHVRRDPTFLGRDAGGTIFHHLARTTVANVTRQLSATRRVNFAFRAYAELPPDSPLRQEAENDPFRPTGKAFQTPLHIVAQRVVMDQDDEFAATVLLPAFLGHAGRRGISLLEPDMAGNTVAGLLHPVLVTRPESILPRLLQELHDCKETFSTLLTHAPPEAEQFSPLQRTLKERRFSQAHTLIDAASRVMPPHDAVTMFNDANACVENILLAAQPYLNVHLEILANEHIDAETDPGFKHIDGSLQQWKTINAVLQTALGKFSGQAN
jgi:hypothetical protein